LSSIKEVIENKKEEETDIVKNRSIILSQIDTKAAQAETDKKPCCG
jgi:hypothetical protein